MISDLQTVREAINGVVSGNDDVSELVSALDILDALIAQEDTACDAEAPVETDDSAS